MNGKISISRWGGTWINPQFLRSSANTEVKYALLKYLFEDHNWTRVEFKVVTSNTVSQRSLERLGISPEALIPRRRTDFHGNILDYYYYSVTDLSWPKIKNHILKLPNYPGIEKKPILYQADHLETQK